MKAQHRFEQEDATIHAFGEEFLVVCPRCSGRALVRDRGYDAEPPRIVLTCGGCGLSRYYEAALRGTIYAHSVHYYGDGQRGIGAAVDWYFHLPLWLQTACCGETLWAYNLRHLDFLEDFVRATHRHAPPTEHGWSNRSLRSRLPRWMQEAGNREAVLAGIEKLRDKAGE
jgi:hypothetical protein